MTKKPCPECGTATCARRPGYPYCYGMPVRRVSLDGEFPITVPVHDKMRWNGWAIPYFTADEVRAFAAWLASDHCEFRVWITTDGAMAEAPLTVDGEIDNRYPPSITVATTINGEPRYDMSGYVWFEDEED